MSGEALRSVLESGILAGKRVCIEEVLPQNATFLIIDISDALGLSIFASNETAEYYNRIASHHNKNITDKSVYDGEYTPSDIVDDVWTAANVYGISVSTQFSVYRANSCVKSDWYEYDIIISVGPLESGTSAEVDGSITIIDRHERHSELKYKVLKDRTVYYS